jgi:hypothetical protein
VSFDQIEPFDRDDFGRWQGGSRAVVFPTTRATQRRQGAKSSGPFLVNLKLSLFFSGEAICPIGCVPPFARCAASCKRRALPSETDGFIK